MGRLTVNFPITTIITFYQNKLTLGHNINYKQQYHRY